MDSKQNKQYDASPEDINLPAELLWENMEAGIQQKIKHIREQELGEKEPRKKRRFLIVLFLLLGAFIGLLIVPDSSDQRIAGQKEEEKAGQNGNLALQSGRNQRKEAPKSYTTMSGSDMAATKPQTPPDKSPVSEAILKYDISLHNSLSHEGFSLEHANKQDQETQKGSDEVLNATNPADSKSDLRSSAAFSSIDWRLPQIENEVQSLASVNDEHYVDNQLKECWNPAITKRAGGEIWLTGGANIWSAGYGSAQPERVAFEETVLSYQGQLGYLFPMRRGLTLMVGIQYQQLQTRLNYSTVIENYEIQLEDTVVQVQVNALTGERTEIRGDVDLTVSAQRDVQHYNSFRLIQFPVLLGKRWDYGKWQTHLQVGGAAHLLLQSSGRTLYQSEIIDYKNSNLQIWSDELGFSVMLGAGMSYQINKNISLLGGLQYQQSVTNWSMEAGVNMRPQIFNLSLGASFDLTGLRPRR